MTRRIERSQRSLLRPVVDWWTLPRVIGLILAMIGVIYYPLLPRLPQSILATFYGDLAPELIGIGITIMLIDWAVERRQEQQLLSQLKTQLRSNSRDVSEAALTILRQRQWLYDGSLQNSELSEANLQESNLSKADLTGSSLYRANLKQAYLAGAKLSKVRAWWVDLSSANLSKAKLGEASLNGANLERTNLSSAYLSNAHLVDVCLTKANLEHAILERADLSGAKMTRAFLKDANLRQADLSNVDLEAATCPGVILSNADLRSANLRDTDLLRADLSGAKLTLHQLSKVFTVEGAVMPNGERLGWKEGGIEGPTFNEWKAQYLAKHGGTETDLRDPS